MFVDSQGTICNPNYYCSASWLLKYSLSVPFVFHSTKYTFIFIVGCSPARTRVQRYQQGCTLVHQNSQHRDLWHDCSSIITKQCCQVMKTESGPRSNRLNVWHCWWRLFGELLLGRLRQASKDEVRRSACCEMLWRSVQETSCHTSAEMNLLKIPTLIYTHEGSWRNLFDILRVHL